MTESQVMSPDLRLKIIKYNRELAEYRTAKRTSRRASLYCFVLTVPLWIVSYHSSGMTGPVNQASWLSALTFFTFVGALASSVAAATLGLWNCTTEEPVRNFDGEL